MGCQKLDLDYYKKPRLSVAKGSRRIFETQVENFQKDSRDNFRSLVDAGLYYYGARYYNSKTSNWLSVDPIALYDPIDEVEHYLDGQHNGGYFNPRNMSVYGYTYQNPVLYVDPNGKQSVSKAADWTAQKVEQVQKTLSTREGRNQVLNYGRYVASTLQDAGLATVVLGAGITTTAVVAPPSAPITAPVGVTTMTIGGYINLMGSGLEALVDVAQAANNDDFQEGKAYTTTATLVVGEGFDFMAKKLGGAMAEEGLSPVKEQILKKLIPEVADKLSGDIIKQESGYQPVDNFVEKPQE